MSFLNILFLLLCKMKNFNFITVISGLEFRRIFLEAWNVTWDSGENSLWSSWLLQSRSVAIPGPDDMTEQAWRLADAYMGLVFTSRIFQGEESLGFITNQLNLNQFLEAGLRHQSALIPTQVMLRCSQDEDHCVKDEWRLGYLESWWLWFPQIHRFSSLSLDFS